MNLRLRGASVESAGLLLLVIAAMWNAQIVSRWDREFGFWEELESQEVYLAILENQRDISLLTQEGRREVQVAIADRIHDRVSRSTRRLMKETESRQAEGRDGQMAWMSKLHHVLIVLSAFLLAIGKWMTIKAPKQEKVAEA